MCLKLIILKIINLNTINYEIQFKNQIISNSGYFHV